MTGLQHFGWFLSRGFGPHGWNRPYLEWDYRWQRPDLYQQSAVALEQAGFDFVLIEDALSAGISSDTLRLRLRRAYGGPKHDPWTLAPFLFAATHQLGVIPTANAGSLHPYVAARQTASLHHLSADRLGINVVTDVGSAHHLGARPLAHDAAYDRAQEWLSGIRALWRSWGDDALVADAASGVYAHGDRIPPLAHRGEYFSFDGPLNAEPFAEGEPLIASPGASARGIDFAGRNSDVQLALAPLDVPGVRGYRERVHAAAAAHGRAPSEVAVLFVVKPVITASAEEADRVVRASHEPDDAAIYDAAEAWSSDLEVDLTALDPDRPLDEAVFGEHVSRGTIASLRGDLDSFADVTLRELLGRKARLARVTAGVSDGIVPTVGTAGEFADFVERLGEAGNDGLLISGDLHPATVHRTLDELVPILRRRGILRREYGTGGLRGHLADF